MSLLMDVLRRFHLQRRKFPVHPTLLKGNRSRRRKAVLLVAVLAFGVSGVAAYFATSLIMTSVQPPPSIPVQQAAMEAPKPEPKTPPPEQPKPPEPKTTEVKQETTQAPKEETPKKEPEPPKAAKLEPEEEVRKITRDIEPRPKEPMVVVSEDPVTYLIMADKFFREGNLPKSKEYYEKAYNIRKSLKTANNLIVVSTRIGDFRRSEEIIEHHKDEKLAYTYLMELINLGRQAQAIEVAKKYISMNTKGFISFALGYAYETMGDYKKALENYEAAYRKDPYNPYFAYNYARLLDYTRNYAEAVRIYRTLKDLEVDPKIKRSVEERLMQLRSMGLGG